MSARVSLILVLAAAFPGFAQQPPAEKPPEKAPEPPSQPAAEQPVAPPEKAEAPDLTQRQPPKREVVWTVTVPTEFGLSTGLVDHPGDVSVSRLGAGINSAIPIGQRSELNLGFEYEYSHYDFKNATDFAAGTASPWKDIHRELFRVRYGTQETMQFSWLVGGAIGLSAEDGADLGKSISGNVYGGGAWNFSEHFKLGGALVFYERMERSPLILPIPTVDWQISEQWRLWTAGKPGVTLFFTPDPQWTFSAGGWYEYRNFRLDKNGSTPDGIGNDSGIPMELGIIYRATRNVTISGAAGVQFWREYELDDSSGNRISRIDSNPSGYFKLQFEYKF